MARRASGSKVSYKELDSDGDDGMAPWGLSDDDDDDADLKALKAAAPLAKKRKKAGRKAVGDTYGARESRAPACRALLRVAADPSTSIART